MHYSICKFLYYHGSNDSLSESSGHGSYSGYLFSYLNVSAISSISCLSFNFRAPSFSLLFIPTISLSYSSYKVSIVLGLPRLFLPSSMILLASMIWTGNGLSSSSFLACLASLFLYRYSAALLLLAAFYFILSSSDIFDYLVARRSCSFSISSFRTSGSVRRSLIYFLICSFLVSDVLNYL